MTVQRNIIRPSDQLWAELDRRMPRRTPKMPISDALATPAHEGALMGRLGLDRFVAWRTAGARMDR